MLSDDNYKTDVEALLEACDSQVVVDVLPILHVAVRHVIRSHDGVILCVLDDDRGDRGASLSRLLLQLLSASRVVDDRDPSYIIHGQETFVDAGHDLHPDVLGGVNVRLELLVGLFQLLDLCEPPGQLGLGVRLELLRLLHFFLGPSPLG